MQQLMQNGTDRERAQIMDYFAENQMKEATYVLRCVTRANHDSTA